MKLLIDSTCYHLGPPPPSCDPLALQPLLPSAATLLNRTFLSQAIVPDDPEADPRIEREVHLWQRRLRDAVLQSPADDLGQVLEVALRGLAQLTDADHLRLMLHAGDESDPLADLLHDHLLVCVGDTHQSRRSSLTGGPLLRHLQARCGALLAVAAISGNIVHGHLVLESDAPRPWPLWQIRAARIAAQTLAALSVPV
jgi:hypothetical protein